MLQAYDTQASPCARFTAMSCPLSLQPITEHVWQVYCGFAANFAAEASFDMACRALPNAHCRWRCAVRSRAWTIWFERKHNERCCSNVPQAKISELWCCALQLGHVTCVSCAANCGRRTHLQPLRRRKYTQRLSDACCYTCEQQCSPLLHQFQDCNWRAVRCISRVQLFCWCSRPSIPFEHLGSSKGNA